MVGHGVSSAGSYLADPTSPIPYHCASIVVTSTLRVNDPKVNITMPVHQFPLTVNQYIHIADRLLSPCQSLVYSRPSLSLGAYCSALQFHQYNLSPVLFAASTEILMDMVGRLHDPRVALVHQMPFTTDQPGIAAAVEKVSMGNSIVCGNPCCISYLLAYIQSVCKSPWWKSEYVNPYIPTQNPWRRVSGICNDQAGSALYVRPDVWSSDLQA